MTAIFGAVYRDGRPEAAATLAHMRPALAAFGRHGSGAWQDGAVALGIQRHCSVPEDRFDRQPLAAAGGRYVVLADIRLDNRPELAAELGIDAERAAAAADSEFVAWAWERFGEQVLTKLIGPFALAVWDSRERSLLLARSPAPLRPLYWRQEATRFLFASMPGGILAAPGVPREPDLDGLLPSLLISGRSGAHSSFAGIARLEAGHLLHLAADGRVSVRRWFELPHPEPLVLKDEREGVEAFRAVFDRVIADHLRSDGKIGADLSGGLDSSCILAAAAPMLDARGLQLRAYTQVPAWPASAGKGLVTDEGPLAARTAAQFANVDHVLIDSADRRLAEPEDLDVMYHYIQEIIPNVTNVVWLFELRRRMAADGVTTHLNGEGGNLTFTFDGAGVLADLLRQGRVAPLLREMRALMRRDSWRRAVWTVLQPFLPLALVLARQSRNYVPIRHRFFNAFAPQMDRSVRLRQLLKRLPGRSNNIREAVQFALSRIDPGNMYKGAVGAFGIDSRMPACDLRLIALLLSLPSRMFFADGEGRRLPRLAFGSELPEDVVHPAGRGLQSSDWQMRAELSRAQLAAALDTATPLAEHVVDLPRLRQWLATSPADPAAKMLWSRGVIPGANFAGFAARLSSQNPAP